MHFSCTQVRDFLSSNFNNIDSAEHWDRSISKLTFVVSRAEVEPSSVANGLLFWTLLIFPGDGQPSVTSNVVQGELVGLFPWGFNKVGCLAFNAPRELNACHYCRGCRRGFHFTVLITHFASRAVLRHGCAVTAPGSSGFRKPFWCSDETKMLHAHVTPHFRYDAIQANTRQHYLLQYAAYPH